MESVIKELLEAQKCLNKAMEGAQAYDSVVLNGGGSLEDVPYGTGLLSDLQRTQTGLDEALGSAYLAKRALEGWR